MHICLYVWINKIKLKLKREEARGGFFWASFIGMNWTPYLNVVSALFITSMVRMKMKWEHARRDAADDQLALFHCCLTHVSCVYSDIFAANRWFILDTANREETSLEWRYFPPCLKVLRSFCWKSGWMFDGSRWSSERTKQSLGVNDHLRGGNAPLNMRRG